MFGLSIPKGIIASSLMISAFTSEVVAEASEPITHIVKPFETIETVADRYYVSVDQIVNWNHLDNESVYEGQEIIVVQSNYYLKNNQVHKAVEEVLCEYDDLPVYVYFSSLEDDDVRYSSLNGTELIFAASLPKVVLALYTMEMVTASEFSWNDEFDYVDEIYNLQESYYFGGSGYMQSEDYRNKRYTLLELVEMALQHSDNKASNMLLYYVAYDDRDSFDRFTNELYGKYYSLTASPKDMNLVMKAIYNHEDDTVMNILNHTDYDDLKLDVIGDVYQKIGEIGGVYNHSTAIVIGDYDYALTVMSDVVSDEIISEIAIAVFDAVSE